MQTQRILYTYASPASYGSIATLAIVNLILDIPAFCLLQNAFSTCVPSLSACLGVVGAWSGVAVAVALAALILTFRLIPWYLPAAYRLEITDHAVTLSARKSQLILPVESIHRYHINVVTDTSALRFNIRNHRGFGNWVENPPEYAGSAVDFHIDRDGDSDVISFPLSLKFAGADEIGSALSGISRTLTRNSYAQDR